MESRRFAAAFNFAVAAGLAAYHANASSWLIGGLTFAIFAGVVQALEYLKKRD